MDKYKSVIQHNFRCEYKTLSEFINWVRENIPDNISNDDIVLDFEADTYCDYGFDGECEFPNIALTIKVFEK